MLDVRASWLRGLRLLSHEKRGVTALEYSLIAALIAMAIVTGLNIISGKILGVFSTYAAALP